MRVALILACLAACSASPDQKCKQVCAREAECAEERADQNYKFDQDECTSVCTALRRDDQGKAIVDRHVACVEATKSCAEVTACSSTSAALR